MTISRRLARLLALCRSTRIERELDDEVIAHLELAERDAFMRGLDPIEDDATPGGSSAASNR